MSKSIKNDADIMLLISQHFSNVSVTESDTVFRVASKERELHKPRLWADTRGSDRHIRYILCI